MGQQRPRQARLIAGRNKGQRQVKKRANGGRSPGRCQQAACTHATPAVDSRPALTTQLAVACLGAGVITSFAVAQGQNPFTALGITLFSAVAAVMVGQVL
jgi:hypothetical protein